MQRIRTQPHLLTALAAAIFVCSKLSGADASVILPPPTGETAGAVQGCSGELMVNRPPDPDSQAITITAFFPLPDAGRDAEKRNASFPPTDLHYLLPSAVIAMEEVNKIMKGYHLQLNVRDTDCNRFFATNELIQKLKDVRRSNSSLLLGVFGPGCLDVTTALSPLAHALLLPQVSYANDTNVPVITSEERRERFPDLFQMVRNVYHTTKTALRVLKFFEWTEQVGFIHDDDLIYTKTVEQLVSSSDDGFVLGDQQSNVTIQIPEGLFVRLVAGEKMDIISNFMGSVRRNLIRVIAGLVSADSACKLVCEAKQGTIPGDGFVFVFIGAYQPQWWTNTASCPCTLKASDVESVLVISSQVKDAVSDTPLELGNTLSQLKQSYIDRLNRWCPETVDTKPNAFFATTYDALLALGLAINNSLPVIDSSLRDGYGNSTTVQYNTSEVYQTIVNSLANTSFTGASGRVTFNSIGERVGVDVIEQIQDGNPTLVGVFTSATGTLDISKSKLRWPGDGGTPQLYPEVRQKTATVAVLVITAIVTLGSNIYTIVLMVFVIRHRTHRIFIASGQRLNYIVFAGAYTAFGTIYIFLVFESSLGAEMPTALFTFFCIVRLYMIMMGFTLTFGTLFVRAWRIYRIFNNPFIARRKYTDTYLILIVGCLAVIDIFLVTVFVSVDSYGRSVSRADPDYDTFTECTYLGCFSDRYFLIGTLMLATYKVLQMLLFIFVVSLVRRGVIERKIYDDSKFLAIALYVTAVVFLIGLPLQVLLSVSFNIGASLAVNMVWVNVSTDVTLFAIYVPKLYQIIYKKVDVRKLMTQKSKFYLYSESKSTIL